MAGRPWGSGSCFVIIAAREDNPGATIYIGRRLYQLAGEPERVDLIHTIGIQIVPGQQYAVAGLRQNGQPRLHIGTSQLEALGLAPGAYRAVVDHNPITRIY